MSLVVLTEIDWSFIFFLEEFRINFEFIHQKLQVDFALTQSEMLIITEIRGLDQSFHVEISIVLIELL